MAIHAMRPTLSPLKYNAINSADNDAEKARIIKNYLAEHRGFPELTLRVSPRIDNGTSAEKVYKEMLTTYSIGFGYKQAIKFVHAISVNNHQLIYRFITIYDQIEIGSDCKINPRALMDYYHNMSSKLSAGESW